MSLHTFINNEVDHNVNPTTSTTVDANNCPLLGQEASSTSDLNPEVLHEKEVVQDVGQKQQDQEQLRLFFLLEEKY